MTGTIPGVGTFRAHIWYPQGRNGPRPEPMSFGAASGRWVILNLVSADDTMRWPREVELSELTGLGPLEFAVLETMESLGATAEHPHVKCHRIVEEAEKRFGYGRAYAYLVICDLARPWTARLSLVDFHGNFGGNHYDAPDPMYTEARLSPLGAIALRSERGEIGPVPIALINGTLYQGGVRPPFDPFRLLDGLEGLIGHPGMGDQDLQRVVGPPSFRQSCQVRGDIVGLYRGMTVMLTLRPRYQLLDAGGRQVIIARDFPPGLWSDDMVHALGWHATDEAWREWHRRSHRAAGFERLAICGVRDRTSGLADHTGDTVEIWLDDGANAEEVLASLCPPGGEASHDYREPEPDLRQAVVAHLGASLRDYLTGWVQRAGANTNSSGLHELRNAIATV
jgi:hypothetical protein